MFNKHTLRALTLLTQIGISLVVTIGLGVYLGNLLDDMLGTKPVFLVIFILLFTASAFLSVYKIFEKEISNTRTKRPTITGRPPDDDKSKYLDDSLVFETKIDKKEDEWIN